MPFGYFDKALVAFWGGTVEHPDQFPYQVNGVERATGDWVGNENEVALDFSNWICPVFGARPPESGTGAPKRQLGHHEDFHYKFWLFPSSLNLSSPTIGADIPFTIWNTFPTPQTLLAINVTGSSVLTFDLVPGQSIYDFQLLSTALQIGAGEPAIDASISFDFTDGSGLLLLRALVASTFAIIPEVPINETWEFVTDTLTTWNGRQSRLSLMAEPRVSLGIKINLVDYADRLELYNQIIAAIKVPSLVPLFQYAVPLTAPTLTGSSRLYFDPTITNMRVGVYAAAMNRVTHEIVLGKVSALYTDGCEIDSAVGLDVTPLWFIMPALPAFIEDGSGLEFGTQAGSFHLRVKALGEFSLIRPGSTQVVNTFDDLPVLEREMLITTTERFSYRRDLLDGGVGLREIRSRDLAVVVKRSLKFSADRGSDDLDYYRMFYSTIRGSQKPFLKSTQLPDITLGKPVSQGASVLTLDRDDYVAKFVQFDAFKRLEVLYANGQRSYHVVTSGGTDAFGVTTITILPGLVNDPDYVAISRISYLQKLVATDTVRLEHFNDYTYVKFNAQTVED